MARPESDSGPSGGAEYRHEVHKRQCAVAWAEKRQTLYGERRPGAADRHQPPDYREEDKQAGATAVT